MLCTHIIYAFAGLDNVTHSIQSRDSELDTEEDGGIGRPNKKKYFKYAQKLHSVMNYKFRLK